VNRDNKKQQDPLYESFDIAYEWNMDTERIMWFGNIAEKLGYTKDELPVSVTGWQELIHPEDREKHPVPAQTTETIQYYNTYRIRRKDGTFIYVYDYGTVLPDEEGNTCKCIGLIGF
jgi:PAS domain S-box-containing protein